MNSNLQSFFRSVGHGNMNEEISNLRDTFFSTNGEYEYIKKLMSTKPEELISLVNLCKKLPDELIAEKAKELVDKIDFGEIPDEEMQNAENKLIIYFLALQDKILLKDLILTTDIEEKEPTRTR